MEAHSQDLPQIDLDAIRTYCEVLFGYLDGYIPVRFIGEKGTQNSSASQKFYTPGEVAEKIWRVAPQAAARQEAVYVVPCTIARPGSAKEEDIVATGVLVVDIDEGDTDAKRDHIVQHLGPPSMVVASGGITEEGKTKYHLYWRLSEAAEGDDLSRVVQLRELAASKVGADDSFKTVTQPIRVAGTIHGKYGKLSPVRLLDHSSIEYHLAELAGAVEAMPALKPDGADSDFKNTKPQRRPAQELMTTFIREGGKDGETRFEALSKIIGHWIRMVRMGRVTLAEAWLAIQQQNAATIQPPWEEDRLRREFNALLRVDSENNGPMPGQDEGSEASAPEFSDDALGQIFVRQCGRDWRYVNIWGQWLHWTGKVWKRDSVGAVMHAARLVCRNAAIKQNRPTDQRRLASAKTIQAVVKIAATDPVIATEVDDLDQHLMLLNTPDGIIDLETGMVSPHERRFLITQITRIGADQGCPTWMAFLETITGGDSELLAYLARVAGYCLTGHTKEQAFFLLHGLGANGKSVFLQTLAFVLGDYATTAAPDTFINRSGTRHLSEIAGLRGARMVLMSETEADAHWAEARIKIVTGGEKLRANFMYKDHFEFVPQFKLLVGTNHRPALGEVGEAMRRRLHLIPFNVTIPPDQRDPDLAEKLQAEASGILGWMLTGCHDLQQAGLRPPACVTSAVDEYFSTEDRLGLWIDECCVVGAGERAQSKVLFSSWSTWAKDNGIDPRSSRFLGEQLRARGFEGGRKVGSERGWFGISLRGRRDQGEDE